MNTPLIPISIISIYKNALGDKVPLPAYMAKCAPDMYTAVMKIAAEVAKKGGKLILSDMFRSYDMQLQSHQDYVSEKDGIQSATGGSFHEAGRAFDMDLGSIKIKLADFWVIAAKYGMVPIIDTPKSGASESWHFDKRGSHQLVYDYYAGKKGNNFPAPYTAAAASAILSIGVHVDKFGTNQAAAALQSGLIRLGQNIGNMDGQIGHKSQLALEALKIPFNLSDVSGMLTAVQNKLQQKFPEEFITPV